MVDKSVAAPPTAMDKDQEMRDGEASRPKAKRQQWWRTRLVIDLIASCRQAAHDRGQERGCRERRRADRGSPAAASRPNAKRRRSLSSSSAAVEAKGPSAKDAGDDDEDVQFVGRKGDLAFVDFPHSRENCMTHPFASGAAAKCANCFCFVCDAPASDCPQWDCQDKHCNATHKSAFWVAKRAAWKANGGAAVAVRRRCEQLVERSGGSSSAAASGDAVQHGRDPRARAAGLPHRSARPGGLCRRRHPSPVPAPVARVHAPDRALDERGAAWRDRGSRGGWLCDEVGMGKTAVCAALILAHKGRDKYKPVPDAAFKNLCDPDNGSEHTYGMTIVICNNTIVQQWVDELKRFAPTLDVRTYYGGAAKGKQKTLNELDRSTCW